MQIDLVGWTRDMWRDVWPRWRRNQQRLRDFEADARQQSELFGALNRRAVGLRQVEVSRIVGSVGRSAEFNAEFQPIHSSDGLISSRFRRILTAMRRGEALPPVELYKLRRWYYVLDGHHRVGAARQLGIESLEAEVTVFVPSSDTDAMQVFHERLAFERATGLRNIGGALPRTYRRLLTEVHAYRRELADTQNKDVDLQTAALQWYARVFLPAFAALRASGIQQHVPNLRHADMLACLWEEQRIARRRLQAVVLGEELPTTVSEPQSGNESS